MPLPWAGGSQGMLLCLSNFPTGVLDIQFCKKSWLIKDSTLPWEPVSYPKERTTLQEERLSISHGSGQLLFKLQLKGNWWQFSSKKTAVVSGISEWSLFVSIHWYGINTQSTIFEKIPAPSIRCWSGIHAQILPCLIIFLPKNQSRFQRNKTVWCSQRHWIKNKTKQKKCMGILREVRIFVWNVTKMFKEIIYLQKK